VAANLLPSTRTTCSEVIVAIPAGAAFTAAYGRIF
jgi:hypothetical protein